jgi:hypothetical protein
MRDDVKQLYATVRGVHEECVLAEQELTRFVKTCADRELLADLAYGLKKTYDFLDDSRKRLKRTQELAERLACTLSVLAGDGSRIETQYVHATPDVKQTASLPNRRTQPDEYRALMDHLGVPRELYDGLEHAAVDVHYPGLAALLTKNAAEGRPPPPGIDPTRVGSEYRLLMRGVKEVA